MPIFAKIRANHLNNHPNLNTPPPISPFFYHENPNLLPPYSIPPHSLRPSIFYISTGLSSVSNDGEKQVCF